MAFGILREQFSRSIEVRVLTNAGKNIQDFASVRLRVLHAIRRHERQSIRPCKIDQFSIDVFLAADEMPLKFNKEIFATKCIDKQLRTVRRILGSARL